MIETTGIYNDTYTKEAITTCNFKINCKANNLSINASNQLEINSAYFNSRDFYYNPIGTLELMNVGSPLISSLNHLSVRQFVTNNMTTFRFPTSYPYYDNVSGGRTQSTRLYVERRRQIHEIKKIYINENTYDYNDTCEMLDQMYIDVYKEQFSILTYWYNKHLAKVPDANNFLLNKVSSAYSQNYIQAGSDEPASYTKQEGIYSVTHSATGTSFYIEIFRGKCVDIRVNATPFNFGTTSYTFSIPKSSLGGAVLGQHANLTFTSYFLSNTLDCLAS